MLPMPTRYGEGALKDGDAAACSGWDNTTAGGVITELFHRGKRG